MMPHEFAYVFYATQKNYLCSAIVAIQSLMNTEIHPNIDIVIMISEKTNHFLSQQSMQFLTNLNETRTGSIFVKEMEVPYQTQHGYYRDCMLKLSAFTLYDYNRVIMIDSDAFINKNLDHLFRLPNAIVASPHAQWLESTNIFITSVLLVIQPDKDVWSTRIQKLFDSQTKFMDMDLINSEFRKDLLVLPRQYVSLDAALATNNDSQAWYGKDVDDAIDDLFIIHFTAHKPWTVNTKPFWQNGKHQQFVKLFKMWNLTSQFVC